MGFPRLYNATLADFRARYSKARVEAPKTIAPAPSCRQEVPFGTHWLVALAYKRYENADRTRYLEVVLSECHNGAEYQNHADTLRVEVRRGTRMDAPQLQDGDAERNLKGQFQAYQSKDADAAYTASVIDIEAILGRRSADKWELVAQADWR